jgi:4-carboxymuconolactone decarboxylase
MRLTGQTGSDAQLTLRASIIETRLGVLGANIALTDESGRLLGPFACMPYSPAVGDALQRLGTSLRMESELSMDCREAAILKVAFAWRSDYLWYVHASLAQQAHHLDEADVKRIGDDLLPRARAAALAVQISGALLVSHAVPAELYRLAVADLGERAFVELVVTIGYYCQLAMLTRAFETPSPPGLELPWIA